MKENKILLICSLMLSLSIVVGSLWIGNSIVNLNKDNNVSKSANSLLSNKALMTEKEAAEYLNLSQEKFKSVLCANEAKRIQEMNYVAYDTYKYIPFVEIDGDKYFNKQELDKWVQYNVVNRIEIDTKGM